MVEVASSGHDPNQHEINYHFIDESVVPERRARERESNFRSSEPVLAASTTSFHFVDDNSLNVADDADEKQKKKAKPQSQRYKTAARRHVMRDIGLSRRKPVRNPSYALEWRAEEPQLHTTFNLSLSLGAGRSDPFAPQHLDLPPPRHTNANLQYLLDHLFTSPCPSMLVTRRTCALWLHLDSTVFSQFLSLSALCLSSHSSYGLDRISLKRTAFHYHACTLSSVQQRFAHPDPREASGDGMVAAILNFASQAVSLGRAGKAMWCWERFFERRDGVDEWVVHMEGMRAVLVGRGGVRSLVGNAGLRRVIFGVDTQGSCVRDVRPYFPVPRDLLPSIGSLRLAGHHPSRNLRRTLHVLRSPTIFHLLSDLAVLASWIQHSSTKHTDFWTRLETSPSYILPIVHACLMLKPASSSSNNDDSKATLLHQVIRYATILFLGSVRRGFGMITDGTALLTSNLRVALERCPVGTWTALETLHLWVLVAAGMEATTGSAQAEAVPLETRTWFLEQIGGWRWAAGRNGVDVSGAALRGVMQDFLWVGVVHDGPFRRMIDMVDENNAGGLHVR